MRRKPIPDQPPPSSPARRPFWQIPNTPYSLPSPRVASSRVEETVESLRMAAMTKATLPRLVWARESPRCLHSTSIRTPRANLHAGFYLP